MKKIILFAFMAVTALFSHASIPVDSNALTKTSFVLKKSITENLKETAIIKPSSQINTSESCSVTMKGSINAGVFSVEVSCTASASSCDQAASKATSCLNAAIRKARQNLA